MALRFLLCQLGAAQLFGDLSMEKDFIENFCLTDGTAFWHGFSRKSIHLLLKAVFPIGHSGWQKSCMTMLCVPLMMN